MQNRTFREQGESSRGTQGNNSIMEVLNAIQKKMEEREKEWNLQQEFREGVYKKKIKKKGSAMGRRTEKKRRTDGIGSSVAKRGLQERNEGKRSRSSTETQADS